MERREFVLQEYDSERRLDRVLKRLLPNRTSSQIYSALRKGLVKINGKKAAENYTTQKGDVLSVAEFLLETGYRGQGTGGSKTDRGGETALPLQEIFKNENFLFINKPRGISVHGKGSLAENIANKISQEKNISQNSISFRPGPLHRLDKDTTGLLAFSQTLAGAKWFSQNIKNHAIKKYYLGIVCGNLSQKSTWSENIDGKEAVSIANPLAIGDIKGFKNNFGLERRANLLRKAGNIETFPMTLVEYQILTGRKHQIRIHSAAHNFPLLGDTKHGAPRIAGIKTFFLHAYKMEFPPNDLGLPPVLQAPLAEEFSAFLKECGINYQSL